MRQIGQLPDQSQASRLAAFLITQGISCEAEEAEEDGPWVVWVHDENRLDEAREILRDFVRDPEDQQYQGHEAQAKSLLREEEKRRTAAQRNTIEVRKTWAQPPGSRTPFVTTMIVLSIVVSLMTGLGGRVRPGSLNDRMASHLIFVTRQDYAGAKNDSLASIKRGQLWRLITPIFLHGSMMHLAFNMFMFYQLGRLLELKLGAPKLALLVLVVAVLSNFAQATTPERLQEVLGGPFFGGMSGVVYGLFGYAWVRSQVDPSAGYFIPPTTVFIMLGWLVLCLTPYVGNIANMAHIAGLMIGMVAAQLR